MRSVLLAPLPAVVTLALIVLSIIPWGGPPWTEMALALLPIAAIYYWSVRRPHLMPAVLVLLFGLVLDALTHSPLGVWAAAALLAALSGRLTRRERPPPGWLSSALRLSATLALAATLVGVLEAGFAWQPVPVLRLAEAIVAACVAYPVLAGLLSLIEPLWPVRVERSLFLRKD